VRMGWPRRWHMPVIVSAVASVASTANAVANFGRLGAEWQGANLDPDRPSGREQPAVIRTGLAGSGRVAGMVPGFGLKRWRRPLRPVAGVCAAQRLYQLQALLGRTAINVANAGS
jgi:hypothetical protein